MSVAEIEGIPLMTYCPSGKIIRKIWGREIYTHNVHVICAFPGEFKNIRSKSAGIVTLAYRVYGTHFDQYFREAEILCDNPNNFLERLIGTTDKRTKAYKEFKEKCALYKAEIMKRRIKST